ncbi:MAG: glycosyltransferase [Eubacterium sp.]|nr:glycosyltransferase [Eubacterium sp.]
MKILIVNPIIYTSETADIKRVKSIKDTMIYDLCLAFSSKGHDVTLVAGEPFRPTEKEEYPFEIIWAKCKMKSICRPNVLPYCPELRGIIKTPYDLIISSEVFSLNSLLLVRRSKSRVIIWHELAKHNNLFHKLPSKLWYGVVARLFFKNALVVPRSTAAKEFISKYCKNVSDTVIDHGVNLDKFKACEDKDSFFIIPSQLIARKQIDKSIRAFAEFAKDKAFSLYIFGEGEERDTLEKLADTLGVADKVKFFGKAPHETLKEYLAKASAMLVYTRKDCNMVSITEAIACATPIVTTSVPYTAHYIDERKLGIVSDSWGSDELEEIVENNKLYVNNCMNYRYELSDDKRVEQFLELI